MRRLLIALWGAVAWLLSRFATAARANEAENLRDELFEARQRIKQLESEKALAEGEVEYLTLWQKKAIESIKAETEAHVARRVLATAGAREE